MPSNHFPIFKTAAFYAFWGWGLGMVFFPLAVLLDGISDMLFGNPYAIPTIGQALAMALGACLAAFFGGIAPAIVWGAAFGVCIQALPTLRAHRTQRVVLAAALGCLAAALLLLVILVSQNTPMSRSLSGFIAILSVVGAVTGGVAGNKSPSEVFARAA